MMPLGVEFKLDLYEKVLQPHEYKKRIVSGVIRRRRLRLTLMMPLGVQFKLDLYEKVLHLLKYETHTIGGLRR